MKSRARFWIISMILLVFLENGDLQMKFKGLIEGASRGRLAIADSNNPPWEAPFHPNDPSKNPQKKPRKTKTFLHKREGNTYDVWKKHTKSLACVQFKYLN
jgi:hypothetical protein